MPKGIFSQGIVVLLSEPITFNKMEQILNEDFELFAKNENSEQWVFGGPSILIPYRPEDNGFVTVDIVDRPWPDHMGDPEDENMLFGAWSLGYFGPFTFPGNLSHAAQQSWLYEDGGKNAAEHKAFIRIRSSYVLGKVEEDVPVLPPDYDSAHEMLFLTMIAQNILQISEALCYFNPNGECLASDDMVDHLMERYSREGVLPLEIWSNIRMFNIPDHDQWVLMDTVGMGQLDTTDHEAVFMKDVYDPNDVVNFLRNTTVHLLANGPVIKNGDIIDGPGGVSWQGMTLDQGVAAPPRPVIRWFPVDGSERPAELQGEKIETSQENDAEDGDAEDNEEQEKKGFFKKMFGV
ncbi:MAG: DUF4261 domain-containing protein [Bacillota bacterium]|nr:DUF4261 domain-containing protein [Bacillota bacterium]